MIGKYIRQIVNDALSRMPGLMEEIEPADTERFHEVDGASNTKGTTTANASINTDITPAPRRPARKHKFYRKLQRYLKARLSSERIRKSGNIKLRTS
jgi:hypothetical protein